MRWSSRHKDMFTGKGPGLIGQSNTDGRKDGGRFGQTAGAIFPAGHRAVVGIKHLNAIPAQRCDIAAGGGVLPHAHIHGGHGEHGLVRCQQQGGRQIIGNSRRHFGQEVGRCRGNDNQIGLARQLDMTHFGLILQVEQIGIDLVLAEGGKRHGGHELLAARGDHATYGRALLAEQAHQLAAFIGGDAPAHD